MSVSRYGYMNTDKKQTHKQNIKMEFLTILLLCFLAENETVRFISS